jgi:hypothetical protein
MRRPSRDLGLCADEFLVCYDYGNGGLWGILITPSEDAIRAKYPELAIVEERPRWMDDETLDRFHAEPLRLEDEPTGLLTALVADRDGT